MPMQIRDKKRLILHGENGDSFIIEHDKMGEPYREGLTVEVTDANNCTRINLFVEDHEAIRMRDLLNNLYPVK